MDLIYLDNNATTQPALPVLAVMDEANRTLWGNPSSVHRFGQAVRQRIELARAQVAELIAARPAEIVFTSGGTESNNLAVRGLLDHTLYRGSDAPGALITTPVEHSAVREPAEAFAQAGGQVMWLEIDRRGMVDPQAVAKAVAAAAAEHQIILVSIQWANNETGVIQPIAKIAQAIEEARGRIRQSGGGTGGRAKIYLHVDATQAAGKLPVDVNLGGGAGGGGGGVGGVGGVDLLTIAGHKFHGPKATGALYIRRGVRLRGQHRGGPQERQKRGGTENTIGIIGMGEAAALARAFIEDEDEITRLRGLRDRLEEKLITAIPDAHVNARDAPRLWNTTNIAFPTLEAEAILLGLSERGVCASAGAACSSGSLDPSPILLAMGVPEPLAHGSVRFSLSKMTTAQEIDQAAQHTAAVITKLQKTMPVG